MTMIAVSICCFGLVAGCGKRYVGQQVNYNWEGWCLYRDYLDDGQKHCRISSGDLIFDFTITKTEKDNEYRIEGHIDPSQGAVKSWDHMVASGTHFTMVVAHEGVVIDTIAFRPRSAYGELGQDIPFTIRFLQPEGFDAVAFVWRMVMRG
jgi:hypothetical protein